MVVLQDAANALAGLRATFATARMADGALADTLHSGDFMSAATLLSKSRAELATMAANTTRDRSLRINTGPLEGALAALEGLLKERQCAIDALTALANRDATDVVLARLSAGTSPQDIEAELSAQTTAAVDAVKSTVARQAAVLDAVIRSHDQFSEAWTANDNASSSDRVVAQLEGAVSRCYALQSQLNEGATFYSNLQVPTDGRTIVIHFKVSITPVL